MIEVELPDGSVAEFPDGTPPEAMKRAIQKRFPPQTATQSPEMQAGLAEMSAMTQNPAKAKYDTLPAWQKPLVAASDVGSLMAGGAANMVGLNLDKGAAMVRSGLGLGSYDDELAEQQRMTNAARNRSGGAGTAAEITGAVALPFGLANKGLTLAGRGGTAAMTGVKGLAARSGLMAAEGAGYGAANAFANDQDIGTGALVGAAGGAAGNVVGEGISAGVGKIAGAFNKKAPQTTLQQLNAAKNAAYDASEKAGVIIKPEGLESLHNKVVDDFASHGFAPENEPGAAAFFNALKSKPWQPMTLKGLDTLRRTAANGYRPGMKSNNALINKAIQRIDELIDSADPSLMAGLDTKTGAAMLKHARKLAHQANKLETAEKLILKGNQQADRNITDTRVKSVKSQIAKINDPFSSWGRGFNAAEKAAAEKAAKYTPSQRALHGLSVLNPLGGGKLSAGGHLAAGAVNLSTGNLPGLALQAAGGLAGAGLGKAGEALANKSVKEFVDLVARGGVPAPVVQNALQRLAASKRDAITRALMAISVNRGTQQPAQ